MNSAAGARLASLKLHSAPKTVHNNLDPQLLAVVTLVARKKRRFPPPLSILTIVKS
jgi:hypothetical protein